MDWTGGDPATWAQNGSIQAGRADRSTSDNYLRDVPLLLQVMSGAGADDVITILATRAARMADPDDPADIAALLIQLRNAGADDAARVLARRAANWGVFSFCLEFQPDEAARYKFGREPDGTPSPPWQWQQPEVQASV